MRKLVYYLLIVTGLVTIDSCQESEPTIESNSSTGARVNSSKVQPITDVSVKGDYEFRGGMLYFKNADTFTKLDTTLRKITPEDRVKFTQKLGFKSLLEVELYLYKKLSEADNKDSYTNLLKSNKDIFKPSEETSGFTTVFEDISAALLNREGMVSIGGRIHCFAKDKTIVASVVDDVRESYNAGKKLKDGTIYLEDKNARARRGFGPCSSIFTAAESSDNNRRVEVRVIISKRVTDIGNNHCNIEYYTYVRGDPFKKSWGSWTYYSTSNNLMSRYSASVKVNMPQNMTPAYQTFYANIDDYRENYSSTFIDYSQTFTTYYGFVLSSTLNGEGFTYEPSLSENGISQGKYFSGGVPNGTLITCP